MLNQRNKKENNGKALGQFLTVSIFFLLIATWFFKDVVFRNEIFITADALCEYYPWNSASACKGFTKPKNKMMMDSAQSFFPEYSFSAKWISAGQVPLWNPHILTGYPFLASGASGLLYPLNFPFFVANKPIAAFGWGALLHLFLAGLFAYLFLRTMNVGHRGAMIGGLAFCFNGWLTVWMILPNFLHSCVWLPLMLCLYEISVKKKMPIAAALGGVAGAMPILSGQVQVGAYSLLLLFAFAVYRSLTTKGFRIGAAAYFLIGACVTVGLSAAQLLPTYELMRVSQRAVATATKLPFDLKHVILAFLPDFYGNPADNNYWGSCNYALLCCYAGALPTLLAIGAAMRSKKSFKWFFIIGAVAAIVLASGSPLNMLLMVVPGLNRIPSPRILFLFTFCVSMLAGIGWSAYEKEASKKARAWVWPACAYAVLFAVFFFFAASRQMGYLERLFRFEKNGTIELVIIIVLSTTLLVLLKKHPGVLWALVLVIIFCDLAIWSKWYNPTVSRKYLYPETQSIKVFKNDQTLYRIYGAGEGWMLFPNSSTYYGFYDIRGIESLYPKRYEEIISEVARKNFGIKSIIANVPTYYGYMAPMTSFLNVKYIMSDIPISPKNSPQAAYEEIFNQDMRITLNKQALPRFYGMTNWTDMFSDEETLSIVSSPQFRPGKNLYLRREEVRGKESLLPRPDPDGGIVPARAIDMIYTPNAITMIVKTKTDIILASSEANFAGWHAFVDGKEVPIFTSNYNFRSIPVPAGEHTIEYEYASAPAIKGAVCGIATAALLLLACLGAMILRRGKSEI